MKASTETARDAREFVISRTFDAPRELVFQAHLEPERLKQWWGPKGFACRSCKVDLRPGGVFHYCLEAPDGTETWGRFVYREIVAPERLVYVVSFSNPELGITRHPWSPDWPLETLATQTFEAHGDTTTVTVKWQPINATEAEIKAFNDGHEAMQQGWTGTFDQLAAYLARTR